MHHSATYKVVGVDAVTGEKRFIEVEADCEKDALLWAEEIGVLYAGIAKMYVAVDKDSLTAEASELPGRVPAHLPIPSNSAVQSHRPKNGNLAATVVVAGIFGFIILVCSGAFNSSSSSNSSEHNYNPTSNPPDVRDSTTYSPAVHDAAQKWDVSDDKMQRAVDQIQAAEDYRISHNVPDPRGGP